MASSAHSAGTAAESYPPRGASGAAETPSGSRDRLLGLSRQCVSPLPTDVNAPSAFMRRPGGSKSRSWPSRSVDDDSSSAIVSLVLRRSLPIRHDPQRFPKPRAHVRFMPGALTGGCPDGTGLIQLAVREL